jgi:hypothetical protein
MITLRRYTIETENLLKHIKKVSFFLGIITTLIAIGIFIGVAITSSRPAQAVVPDSVKLTQSAAYTPEKMISMRKEDIEFKILLAYARLHNPRVDPINIRQIVRLTKDLEIRFLLYAIMRKESNFEPDADNGLAGGLCGINYKVNTKELIEAGIWRTLEDVYEIEPNIKASIFYLQRYIRKSPQDIKYALRMYFMGDTYARDKRRISNYPEHTLEILGRIRGFYEFNLLKEGLYRTSAKDQSEIP